jgi:hypothetical protein
MHMYPMCAGHLLLLPQAMGPMADTRAIIIINAHGIVQVVNHATSELTCFLRHELVGRNVSGPA